jgi:hypothetical protein
MRPANKIQNKIYPTRSRSVHPSFPLLSNSLGATVHRGNVVLLSPRRTSKSCNVGAVGKGFLVAGVAGAVQVGGWLRPATEVAPPGPTLAARVLICPTASSRRLWARAPPCKWCPCARPRSRSCGRPPVEPSSQGAGPDRVEKMTEPADIVTCQSCGAGSTEPEARKRGWVASEGRWACDNCLSSGRDSGSERDRLPPSG